MEEYYVYVYIDPRNFEEFYYGKGKGNRKEAHLISNDDSDKARIIKEIQNEGLEPIIKVIARNLTEKEALLVEKTLIWKLGRTLTNISSGHFANKFRPHNKYHLNLSGFDFQNGIFYVNVGEGEHRCWEDCKRYGFLSAGQDKKWSDQLRTLNEGDIVVAYLKGHGYVGVGKIISKAVPVNDFKVGNKSLRDYQLKVPNIFDNSDNDKSEYLIKIDWIKALERNTSKWKKNSKLFTTQLIKASLDNQPKTIKFIESEFNINFESILNDNKISRNKEKNKNKLDFVACMLGGAIGDALGAPIEFLQQEQIFNQFGETGISDFIEFENGLGEFTDDTQMSLFTAEALLRAYHRAMLKGIGGALNQIAHHSYLRWLHTQGIGTDLKNAKVDYDSGFLVKQRLLYKKRAPGNTILTVLTSGNAGSIEKPINDSKGCGTIMRVAPVGLMYRGENETAFKIACEISAITHGNPTGYLSAGFFASVISDLAIGIELKKAISNAIHILKTWKGFDETLNAVQKALDLFEEKRKVNLEESFTLIEKLGQGWIAEEALSMSLYASLIFENDFKNGILCSINHSGDSDSTGSITGNILGLINGIDSIPKNWSNHLVGKELIIEVGKDLYTKVKGNSFNSDDDWWEKYPGF